MAGEIYIFPFFLMLLNQLYVAQRRRRFLNRVRLFVIRNRRNRIMLMQRQLNQGRRYQRRFWTVPRPQLWFDDMLQNRNEDRFWREHFRISRNTFQFICNLVRPELTRQDTTMRQAIAVEKRVAVALWRLATGDTYRATGLIFGIGRCTAMKCRDEFCSVLIRKAKHYIKFPKGENETRRAIQEFENISTFPQVVGALLDGTHIKITAPRENPNDYYNRKKFHSMILQAVADANYKFIHVSTGYAGSMHDVRALRISSLIDAIDNAEILVSPVKRTPNRDEIKPLLFADPA